VKRVVIAAGGTGGHFYPGLVAALELKKRGWEPLLIVKKDDPAKARLEQAGLACLEVDLVGMPRRIGPGMISFGAKLIMSLSALSRVMRDFKPDLALGMGGYLTFPVAYAAWRRGIPIALHESNSILGLANKAAAGLGGNIFWGLPPANGDGVVVGTPVRPALLQKINAAEGRKKLGLDPAKKTILVFGGSQGAEAINKAMPKALKEAGIDVQVLHLSGKGKAEETKKAYSDAGQKALVLEYLENMAAAYAAADVVVCRAGASTLAELFAQRKTAVLVPYPHAAANHQDANARVFEKARATTRITETDLYDDLGPCLADMLSSPRNAEWTQLGLPSADRTTTAFVDQLEKLL